MLSDLLFLVFCLELVLLLNAGLTLRSIPSTARPAAALLILKSSLPLTLVMLTGALFLVVAADSTRLTFIHDSLNARVEKTGMPVKHSLSALGILLVLMGGLFRMGAIPVQFQLHSLLTRGSCWMSTSMVLISMTAGLSFLILFANQMGVVQSAELEQILFFSALIILTVSAGLLLVEKQMQSIFNLLIIQTTGVFLALLSAVCWRWRHATGNPESGSILQTIQEYIPELLFSYLAIVGLACLLDGLASPREKIIDPSQLQGLFADQRLAGGAAVVLLLTLIGFPGLAVFRLKWETLLQLLEIHQPSMTGTMATLHAGYLVLALALIVSSALTAFVCARLLILICFARPLTRYRRISQRRMIIACYCCVIGSLIFSLKMMINF